MGGELEGKKTYFLLNIKKMFIFETESDHVALSGTHCIDQAGLEVRSAFSASQMLGLVCHYPCATVPGKKDSFLLSAYPQYLT